ncbi:MAG TPA: glycosyltransferase [Solirubrobacteraceae bacterium]|nr:glycosyltransferase [Solirubrobacteraceae bacterium]
MPHVSVVVPARDAAAYIGRLLAALDGQDAAGGSEVIVVDNGSRDETAELAEAAPAVDRVLRRSRGEGPGAARNAGAAVARGEVLAFLDADCWPAPGWLRAGVEVMRSSDVLQGRVLPDPAITPGPFDRTLTVNDAHGLFESANLFTRRELLEEVGGFPVGLESAGASGSAGQPFGEDVVFGWRARRAGARTAFCAEALAYHAVFRRGPAAFVLERARLRYFPELARQVPELRDAFFYRRYFHGRRSAAFDLAVVGVLAGVATRRRLALLGAAPYLSLLGRDVRRWGRRRAPLVAAIVAAGDGVGALALLRGSLVAGTLLL